MGPFVVEKDLFVPEGKQVEIPAGCVFLFSTFTGLIVHGQLKVLGSADKPVVFTSIFDSEYNQASTQLSNPFDWNGILVSPSSAGSYFNNFKLCFSVYGIKSQSKNVVIQNGIFKQNGQFHFTVYDNIQFVQEDIPFSYGVSQNQTELDSAALKSAVESMKKESRASGKGKTGRQTKIFRYTSLGIGVVGAGVGVFFTARAIDRLNESEDIKLEIKENPAPILRDQYDDALKENRQSIAGAAVSYGIGLLGFIGFGVSFAF
jgi:hypothetical protein